MHEFTRTLSLVGLCLALSSCGSKFHSSKDVDFAPFAEQTIASISELDPDLARDHARLTRDYFDQDQAELVRLGKLSDRLYVLLGETVEYSVRLVSISRSDANGRQKAGLLADYLAEYKDAFVLIRAELGSGSVERMEEIPPSEAFDEILTDVRRQEKFLDALVSAQPIIDATGTLAAMTVIEMRQLTIQIEDDTKERIEEDFAKVRQYFTNFNERRDELFAGLELIHAHRHGDAAALDTLMESGLVPAEVLADIAQSGKSLDDQLETYLSSRLKSLFDLSDRVEPEVLAYQAIREELRQIVSEYDDEVRQAWGVLFVWTRAHDKLARGSVNPAEWFNLNDAPKALFKLAEKAL